MICQLGLLNEVIKLQGVYKIENIKNHKKYIGSSINIEERWKNHRRMLEQNKHHSSKLQRAYNKLKDKNILQYSIVETVDNLDKLKDREQYWIDYYDAYHSGYNCSEKVDNPKYAHKNNRKRKNIALTQEEYAEFDKLYNEDLFKFGSHVKKKLVNKEYKHPTVGNICKAMKWFIENDEYDKNQYHMIFYWDNLFGTRTGYVGVKPNCERECVEIHKLSDKLFD